MNINFLIFLEIRKKFKIMNSQKLVLIINKTNEMMSYFIPQS